MEGTWNPERIDIKNPNIGYISKKQLNRWLAEVFLGWTIEKGLNLSLWIDKNGREVEIVNEEDFFTAENLNLIESECIFRKVNFTIQTNISFNNKAVFTAIVYTQKAYCYSSEYKYTAFCMAIWLAFH